MRITSFAKFQGILIKFWTMMPIASAIRPSLPLILLSGCAHISEAAEQSSTRYECIQAPTFAQGQARALIRTSADGVVRQASMLWWPSAPEAKKFMMRVYFDGTLPEEIDLNRGLVIFDWKFDPARHPEKISPRKLSMELRANPTPPWRGRGVIRDDFSWETGVRLSADWGDVQAFARGADKVYLVVRHDEEVIEVLPLDQSVFAMPTAELEQMLAANRKAAMDPQRNCEDVLKRPIVV